MAGKWPARRELAREHDVAVENRARRVGDRLVEVVALDQHGVEAGDAAASRRCRRARAAAAATRTPTADSPWSSGGSPTARPISRCAIATRVTESIISSTCLPWSRKYSAIAVATSAPRARTQRGLVAGRDDHHRTCEPFRAEDALDEFAHFAAALADQRDHVHVGLRVRAIMPSSVLLPTPDPAKMPTRWPRRASAGRRWRARRSRVARRSSARSSGWAARPRAARARRPSCPLPSIGWPRPLMTRPSSRARRRRRTSGRAAARCCPGAIRPARRAASAGRRALEAHHLGQHRAVVASCS